MVAGRRNSQVGVGCELLGAGMALKEADKFQ